MALSDAELAINLYTEGEKFFDLLKAVIRNWQKSNWGHERERALYARELYERSLAGMREHVAAAKDKAENGYFTELDQRILARTEEQIAYWEKKLDELTGGASKTGC